MSRKKQPKPGYLGPAFYEWLKHLEMCEKAGDLANAGADAGPALKGAGYAFSNELWPSIRPEAINDTIRDMLPVDAWLAERVRSSHKYRVDLNTLTAARRRYSAEFDAILETMPVEAPFPNTTVCFSNLGPDDLVMNICRIDMRENNRGNPTAYNYDTLEITRENPYFYSASMALVRTRGPEYGRSWHLAEERPSEMKRTSLSSIPVEIHFNVGRHVEDCIFLNAIAAGVDPTQKGKDTIELARVLMLNFFASFHLGSALRKRQPGRIPNATIKGPAIHKKQKRPRFEHWVVEFELDQPEPEQTGIEREQPKKRRHEVRGFERRYQNPIKHGPNKGKTSVWVDGHWRGDARLGILKRDEEITLHKEDEHRAE